MKSRLQAYRVERSLFVRMAVGRRRVLVTGLAVLVRCSRVLLCLIVLAEVVMVSRLMMMMCCCMVVSGRLMVMVARRMFR